MRVCSKCDGFVPASAEGCPNCRSTKRWWAVPLSLLGAGATTVTLSACYGAPCVATTLPDGGKGSNCSYRYDCNERNSDGGLPIEDSEWVRECADAGRVDGGVDGGSADGGHDAGP